MKKTSSLDTHIETTLRSELGNDYDRNRVKAVMQLMREFRSDMRPLEKALKKGEIDGRTYANSFNTEYRNTREKMAKVLGPTDYAKIFGEAPGEYPDIVNPDIEARAYPKR